MVYNCAFCGRKAIFQEEHNIRGISKVSFYCRGHAAEGLAFGFLEKEKLKKI